MVREDGKRNFALRGKDGEETSVFSGDTPRQAALKAARRLEAASSESKAKTNTKEIRLRERGTDKIHQYEAWAWEEEEPEGSPDWLAGPVTKGNVSKQGIRHLDD